MTQNSFGSEIWLFTGGKMFTSIPQLVEHANCFLMLGSVLFSGGGINTNFFLVVIHVLA